MEFNDNNKKEQVNVNTRGSVFMNSDSPIAQSTLVTGYWNNMLSIKLHPTLPEEKQTEYRKFDYDTVVNTSLTEPKIAALYVIFREAMDKLKSGEPFSKGVSVGQSGLINVRVKEGNIALELYKNIDETTRQSKNYLLYIFRDEDVIEGYDAEAGSFTMGDKINAEAERFLYVLKAALIQLSNAGVHAYRHVEKFYKDRLLNNVNAIANKNGIDTGSTFSRGGSNSGGGSFWTSDNTNKEKDTRSNVGVEHSNEDELRGLM